MKLYGIIGWKNAGKTTLTERLVAEITARGFAVSTVKHAHHAMDIDKPGKDSHRHRAAGAQEVMLSSSSRWALMHELRGAPEEPLSALLSRLSPCDLVLIEGFKRDTHPKVEVHRPDNGQPLIAPGEGSVRAVASDAPVADLPDGLPLLDLNDVGAVADFILAEVGLGPAAPAPRLRDDCFALPPGVAWTPVDEALARLDAALVPVTGTETVETRAAMGRVLAQDVRARRSNPPGANAAVDGYGFAHAALGAALSLPLAEGRAAAGAPYEGALEAGKALRILTGALLPAGVDTVVLQEDVEIREGRMHLAAPPKRGANTRKAGEDVAEGALALASGRGLGAPDLALLSALGVPVVTVRRRLRVGVLSTGDELAEPGSTQDPARTFDANRPMLLAMAARWGYGAVDLGHVADDRGALRARLDAGAAQADVILTSGGASAGDEDHVSRLLSDEGRLSTWRVAVKPGRPLALAQWSGVPVFGLPGNPVAAFVCALIFARPALSKLAGSGFARPAGFDLPAAFTKSKKPGRREFLRARIGPDGRVEVFASEGSGRISGLSWAEGLVELPDEAAEIRLGDPVRYLPFSGFGL